MSEIKSNKETLANTVNQRDDRGLLTPLASALNAIDNAECDCEISGTCECLPCLCRAALRGLWEDKANLAHKIERMEEELKIYDEILSSAREWTRTFGAELCPGPYYADTFGEGMRSAKTTVALIMNGLNGKTHL
jgi:hypothetical protein